MPRPADRRVKIALLRAAEAVFSDKGLSEAKVEEITSRAGVSKGAFYLHFASKEDCWKQIVEGFLARLASCTEPTLSHELTLDVPGLMRRAVEHDLLIFEFCWQNRALMRMFTQGGGGVPYAFLIDEFAARLHDQLVQWIALATSAKLYRPCDPHVTASLLAGGYDRLVRELVRQPKKPDLSAWVREAVTFFARAMFVEPEPALLALDEQLAELARRPPPPLPSLSGVVSVAQSAAPAASEATLVGPAARRPPSPRRAVRSRTS
jgi:AcrR family transcriptional regulator